MAFVPVPKDLNRVKTKVMFNLIKRQLICFAVAAVIGVPVYFLTKPSLGITTAAMLMVVLMLPCIFFALYEKDGQPAEKVLDHMIKAMFLRDSGSISTTTKDYIIGYQDLQGIGMTNQLALPTLIALCSIALNKPTLSNLAVLGEISISGMILKVNELANALQVCLDSGAKKVLLSITSAGDLATVPAELIGCFNIVFYQSAEDAVFKALGVD